MNKGLQRHGGRKFLQFAEREFPRQNDLFHSKPLRETHALGGCNSHLGGSVHAQPGKHAAGDFRQTDILDNHGIHRRIMQGLEFGDGVIQFFREDQHIQGDIGFDAVGVEKCRYRWKLVLAKVVSTHARVEAAQAKENGISSVRHSGSQALPVACRREEFWFGWTSSAQ